MASIIFRTNGRTSSPPKYWVDGKRFANAAIEFTALAMEGEKAGIIGTRLHLYALAIEVAFKSLAIRSGSSPMECKKASHAISKMVAIIESYGTVVPDSLKRRLNDDRWFKKMLDTRYPNFPEVPSLEETLFFHRNYPEMIAEILEIPCSGELAFDGGSALKEITTLLTRRRNRSQP